MPFAVVERLVKSKPSIHNLFFTLYPDDAAAERIARLQGQIRDREGLLGKPMAKARLHISLNGLGVFAARPEQLVAEVSEAVSQIRMPSFVVALNTVTSWNGAPRPLVIVGDEGVYGVRWLHTEIHEALAARGIGNGREPAFNPHLTLLRDPRDLAEEMIHQVEWQVREFRLVDSLQGQGRHDLLGTWALD